MSRNKDRLGGHTPEPAEAPQQPVEKAFDPLSFVAPTEFVDLPSKGNYPETHPLHGQEVIEMRFMTAKEEDILSSQTLLKKGLAIERMLDSLIINKAIKAQDLLVGDRNALIIAARISGYGANYKTQINCPSCGSRSEFDFDLTEQKIHESSESEELNLKKLENGNFTTKMPYSKFNVEFKLLDGKDEQMLTKLASDKRKRKMIETVLTDQFKQMIVSIEGHSDRSIVSKYVDNMPTLDSTQLKACYKVASPDVKITNDFECNSCGHSQEMEVPFNTDFFWPNR
jgi:transcription elongation factor Elf1